MPAKITSFHQFIESFKKSKHLERIDFSDYEMCELNKFFISFYNDKNKKMGKSPVRYLYMFINNNKDDGDWITDIERIIELGNKANKEKMCLMYGETNGLLKWESYIESQKNTNSFEYKNTKYGMTKDEFDSYNKSRACTLQNMIKRHGELDGLLKWNEYCDRQRYTTTLEYFQSTYGYEDGTKKYNDYISKIIQNISSLNELGFGLPSKLEQVIIGKIPSHYNAIKQYRYESIDSYTSSFDIYIEELNLLIEINGDFWHMNPTIYSSEYINPVTNLSAKQKWHLDKLKLDKAKKSGYYVEVIWEADYNNNNEIIGEIIEQYEKRNNRQRNIGRL